MSPIVVTGAGGQLGSALLQCPSLAEHAVLGLDRAALDVSDAEAVSGAIRDLAPGVIVNAAAYTAVDRAETEPGLARAVNVTGVQNLARAASAVNARLVHISTDYVFDGTKDGWYVEHDPVAPVGVYGVTKAEGEDAARWLDRHLILRTSWVYSATHPCFVATMVRLAAERDEIAVVDDQVGCPTSAGDLATAIAELIVADPELELRGTFHLASPTAATWYQFARAILADQVATGSVALRPISTAEFPTAAARPANSRLDSSAISRARGIVLPPWEDALASVRARLL